MKRYNPNKYMKEAREIPEIDAYGKWYALENMGADSFYDVKGYVKLFINRGIEANQAIHRAIDYVYNQMNEEAFEEFESERYSSMKEYKKKNASLLKMWNEFKQRLIVVAATK